MEANRINKACAAYPCHDKDKLYDCTFCYCPLYPCYDTAKGTLLIHNKTWDCSKCTWIHQKEIVDKAFEILKTTLL
jgi:Zn-finger protein